MERVPRILFVCTGNAGRSQMARALAEKLGGPGVFVHSAGVAPWPALHPMAVKLMAEQGLDISQRQPRPATAALTELYDLVVTIGEPARQRLPQPLPGNPRIVHWDIADPADADGTERSEAVFRQTMAQIAERLPPLLAKLRERTRRSRVHGRPGLSTGIWYPGKFEPAKHLPQAVAAGFAAIELNLFLGVKHFDYHDPHQLRQLRQVAGDLGVEIWSIHDPNCPHAPGALNPTARQAALDELRRSLDLAHYLGASAIPTHALAHHAYRDPAKATREQALEALLGLVPAIRASGARLAIENGYPGVRQMLPYFARLPAENFGFVIDTGHANLDESGALEQICQATVGRMISLHLNDNCRREDSHLPPGLAPGTLAWPAVAQAVRATGYDGCILWEVFAQLAGRQDDPAPTMARTMAISRQYFSRPAES